MFGERLELLDGCLVLPHDEKVDERGFFKYVFQSKDFSSSPAASDFRPRQVNHSFSSKSVLRGIHREPWSKYVYVPSGRAIICVVNLDPQSHQFGAYMLRTVGDFRGGREGVFLPEKFGNAFYCLEDTHYLNFVSEEFVPHGRTGFLWNDPFLDVSWDLPGTPILSLQDSGWGPFSPSDL